MNRLSRNVQMNNDAWEFLIRSIQLACILLLCSLSMLFAFDEGSKPYSLYIQSRALQEYAQTALLLAAIIPVCLQDLSGR